MRRSEIPGQEELKAVISRLVDDERLPHALLLQGVEGGASLPLALYITQYLMCDNKQGGEVCGECSSCLKNQNLSHPDVHFVIPINTSKSVKGTTKDLNSDAYADEWREAVTNNPFLSLQQWYAAIDIEKKQGFIGAGESKALRAKLALRAYEGKSRVFIIWHADRMNPEFGNKMLKNFEEPNPNTVFILITESPSKLLSTIISRVQRFQEQHYSDAEIAQFIAAKYQLDTNDAMNLAFRAEGNLQAAVKEASDAGDPWLEVFRDWMRLSYRRDLHGLFLWGEKMSSNTRETQRIFIESALKVLDRCFRMGWLDIHIPMEGEEADFYKNFSPFINASNVTGFLELLEETAFHIDRYVNPRIVWYDTSIKSVRLVHQGKKATASS
jgi:DNA polymerase-3 subunit delta'